MTELFLLGAGASVEAGIPAAYRMTNEMLKKFERTNYPQTEKVIRFVAGGLLFQQGIRNLNPYDGVNIEDLFNAILLLADRQSIELVPFIGSWHPQLERLASGELLPVMSRELLETIYTPIEEYLTKFAESQEQASSPHFENFLTVSKFEEKFKRAIKQLMAGGEEELLRQTAQIMIYELVRMVWITDPTKINYIIPLVKHAHNTNSVIATLNYDNAIELAGQVANIDVDTGFDVWSDSRELKFANGKVHLLKLHGSMDWELSDGKTSQEKPLPFQVIQKIDVSKRDGWFRPTVVFGSKNKLTAKGPFLGLLQSFEQRLSNTDLLTIIGYSLHDEHVNEFIATWFNEDTKHKIRIIDPQPENLEKNFAKHLIRYETKDRVQVIKETAANGIASITNQN